MNMKRLVIVSQYFPPEMGAPQSRLLETAKGLRRLGWDVTVISAMPNYPTGKIFAGYKGKFHSKEDIGGIEVWRYWLYASNSRKALPRILSMLSFSFTVLFSVFKIRRLKPDYLFTESPPLTLGLSGLLLAKLSGARHVMNISDLWPLTAYELGAISKGFAYDQLERVEHWLYRYSYACTGQSREIVNHLSASGSRRTHLYRNGVDASRFAGLRKGAPRGPRGRLKVVYAGLLGVSQGILKLCENIDFAERNAEWHIYGDGVEKGQIASFLETARARGIFLHGSVPRDQLPSTIARYDAALVPLRKSVLGGVPSKIYEAMAAGLPIIYSGGGEGAEIVEENRVGWNCEPSNYGEIARRIAEVAVMSAGDLEAVKRNCLHAARNIFDRQKQIEQLDIFLSGN